VVISLNLKSFEACIEKIAAGMGLDEALEIFAQWRGHRSLASRKRRHTRPNCSGCWRAWRLSGRSRSRPQQTVIGHVPQGQGPVPKERSGAMKRYSS
jgi:hypothetical protein